MSDKIFLKDITLPIVETGEDETYSFVQTDSDLETAGDAADAKKVGDELTELKNDLTQLDETTAKIDGSYDTMTVGNAKQLTSNVGINDKAPYLFRTAGGANDIGDREEDVIVGGSVVWNQLVQNGDFSDGTSGWAPYLSANGSIAVSDGTLTYTVATAGSSGYGFGFQRSLLNKPTIGHKYLYCANVRFSVSGVKAAFEFGGSEPSNVAWRELTANTWTSVVHIVSASASLNRGLMIKPKGGSLEIGATMDYRNIMLTDLTATFGSTIADYVYTLESATAGAGVAWLRKYGFFTKDYYPYTEPTFKHVEGLASHKMVGFNAFDGIMEDGSINDATGQNYGASSRTRSKNYIPVVSGLTYYAHTPGRTGTFRIYFYDSDKNFIKYISAYSNATFTVVDSARYIRFRFSTAAIPEDANICINLHWDGERDGEYEPYKEYTYPLDDSLILMGKLKLDANNDLYYDGDVYEADGTVERWFIEYTVTGQETVGAWYPSETSPYGNIAGGQLLIPELQGIKIAGEISGMADGGYRVKYANTDKTICTSAAGKLAFINSDYSTREEWLAGITGVTVVLKLATPTTETADPFQTPQVVDDWGTEEYVYADGAFPIPVGHDTFYAANLKAKLEMAPDSPGDGDGDYIVRQTNGLNEYVKMVKELPSAPTTDGSYHLEVTVASGTPTLTWVADE